MGRLSLVASIAVGVIGVSGASAAQYEVRGLPELGRCVKVSPGTGVYPTANCITAGSPGTGNFNWIQLTSGEKRTFTASALESTLTTVGQSTITCLKASISGEYTGPKNATVHIEFHECSNGGAQCQSEPTAKGEIKTFPLEAELGFIKNQVKEGTPIIWVGLDLKPQSPFPDLMVLQCGAATETVRVEGSVIGRIKPLEKMTVATNLIYTATRSGKQVPEKFEGGLNDTLTTTFTLGIVSTTGASTLTIKGEAGQNSVPLEIKAKGN
jgi:hypothetical protein